MSGASDTTRSLGTVLIAGAGLLGAAGVVLSAVAAHAGGGSALAVAGSFCILHATAALAIGIGSVRSRTLAVAGLLLLAGATLFAGGIAAHAALGRSPGPFAPLGGVTLVVGWLLVAVGGCIALWAKTAADQP